MSPRTSHMRWPREWPSIYKLLNLWCSFLASPSTCSGTKRRNGELSSSPLSSRSRCGLGTRSISTMRFHALRALPSMCTYGVAYRYYCVISMWHLLVRKCNVGQCLSVSQPWINASYCSISTCSTNICIYPLGTCTGLFLSGLGCWAQRALYMWIWTWNSDVSSTILLWIIFQHGCLLFVWHSPRSAIWNIIWKTNIYSPAGILWFSAWTGNIRLY